MKAWDYAYVLYQGNKLILKAENRCFIIFPGVSDPGRGITGPALLEVRLSSPFARRFQRRLLAVFSGEIYFYNTGRETVAFFSDKQLPKLILRRLRCIERKSTAYPEETENVVG